MPLLPLETEPGPSDTEPERNECDVCGKHSMSGICERCWERLPSIEEHAKQPFKTPRDNQDRKRGTK